MSKSEVTVTEILFDELVQIQMANSDNIEDFINLIPDLDYENFKEFIVEAGLEENTAAKQILKELYQHAENKHTAEYLKKAHAVIKPKESMLFEFFTDQLKDIYWGEKHLIKMLPKLKKATGLVQLQEVFEDNLEQATDHLEKLEVVFESVGKRAQAKKSEAMAGIVEEGINIIEETESDSPERNLGLVFAAQKVAHYQIASYGGLVQLAKTLNLNEIVPLFSEILNDKIQVDVALAQTAGSFEIEEQE